MDKLSFILALCIFASGTDATATENCLLLQRAIGDYINGTIAYGNALYLQMGAEGVSTSSESLDYLNGTSGYDLRVPSQLHAFACKLAETNDRDDVAEVFGISRGNIDQLYDTLLGPIDGPGQWGLYGVMQVGQIMLDLLNWANRTGYPVLPFSINKFDTLNTYKKVQFGLKYSAAARETLKGSVPFPLALRPEQAVKVLSEGESYDQLEKDMKIEIGALKRYANWKKGNPRAVIDAIIDVEAVMEFLMALDKTRILYY